MLLFQQIICFQINAFRHVIKVTIKPILERKNVTFNTVEIGKSFKNRLIYVKNNLLRKQEADIACDSSAKLFETLKMREVSNFHLYFKQL